MYAKQILSHDRPRISIPSSVGDAHALTRKGDKVRRVKGEKTKRKKKGSALACRGCMRVSHVSISPRPLIGARREHLIIAVRRSNLILLSSQPPLL